jgi:hypothetical protein
MKVRSRSGSGPGTPADEFENLPGFGMALEISLGKDQIVVHGDLKHTARGLRQANFAVGISLFQLGGQTGRPGVVVSNDAELDGHFHAFTSVTEWSRGRIVAIQCRHAKSPILP